MLANGSTYTGPYNATTISGNSWTIGPGVAPKADIYGVRVFGCEGSTDVTVDAIEWAVDNDMDVINMSLGSSFGTADDPSAVASTNAAKAGVIVVTSAGNSGPNQYITGSPGTADGALSTAANDSTPEFPGVAITLSSGLTHARRSTRTAMPSERRRLTARRSSVIDEQPGDDSQTSRSAAPSPTSARSAPGKIAVVEPRHLRPRRARRSSASRPGPAAVVDGQQRDDACPPFEGQITGNPDDGVPFTVTIPFLGVRGLRPRRRPTARKLRASNGTDGDIVARGRSRTRTSRASRTSRPAARGLVTAT